MSERPAILSAADIEAMEGTRKTHFLNPEARRVNRSLGDRTGLDGFGFHIITVEPGCLTTEHHVHHHEDECVFVLEGEATATIGDEEFAIGPGDFVAHPRGGPAHSIRNTGPHPLRCIVVGERRAHDVADYPRLGKRIFRNEGLAWNLVDLDAIAEPKAGGK